MSDSTNDSTPESENPNALTRRSFLATSAAAGVMTALPLKGLLAAPATAEPAVQSKAATITRKEIRKLDLKLNVNGTVHELRGVDPRTSLLDALRENLQLSGTKKGCDHGQCGACTVMVDGKRVNSCLTLAGQNQGKEIISIEGLAKGETLHPMQQAFIEEDAYQCGFCTPGQIMSAVAMLKEPCGTSETETRECMSGNICRCGAYRNILKAIAKVRDGKVGQHASV